MEQDCIFCRIRDGEIPSDVLYRDDSCFVVRDIAPKAPVHLLVIPTSHFTFLSDLTPDFHSALGGMFEAAHRMAQREGVDASGYRLVVNQGADSGQMIDHLHLHVLGGRALGEMG
jgi:histidine triad (HIT) family protein